MKIKAKQAAIVVTETTITLTLDAAEAIALFWSIAPDRIPERVRDQYQDIAREIEEELGEVIEKTGLSTF